jgi:dimeric dUTPase (all-alpha-NTP-PPase superfamily)
VKGENEMNLEKLFQMQTVLDEHIMKEHPELKGQNNLDWKVLALQVELGECANEWRGFKKWSNNQKPRQLIYTNVGATIENAEYLSCMGCGNKIYRTNDDLFEIVLEDEACPKCNDYMDLFKKKNPLLEEYVDCLHFILSIGLEMGVEKFELGVIKKYSLIEQFIGLSNAVSVLAITPSEATYGQIFSAFVGLGEMLGFSWKEVEQAYFDKNAVNHQRQESGY